MTTPSGAVSSSFGFGAASATWGTPAAADPTPPSRLERLLAELDALITQRYAFDVFAAGSINFGVLATYRQTWEPRNYQVGDLVSTLPLAPKEVRRFTTKRVEKRSRAQKEIDDNLRVQRTDSTDTSRAESEIIEKAQKKSSFQLTASQSFGEEGAYEIKAGQMVSGSEEKESQSTKRAFRESVLKSAQEYRQQHRVEVDTTSSVEDEQTTYQEIQNPNDELTVTYLMYELQRTFLISERLHKLTPVILVANDVPAPHEIDDAWLVAHDWIVRRAILDDSFRAALDYLVRGFTGAEINIAVLESNAQAQKRVVESIGEQIRSQVAVLNADERDVLDAIRRRGDAQQQQGLLDAIKRVFFDPLGITGDADTGAVDAAQAMVDYATEARDRADREKARLLDQMTSAVSALQSAVDRLAGAVREHYDNVAAIDRLRAHVKANILYYMQAIWAHEPPDQRFFRLYDIDVPMIEVDAGDEVLDVTEDGASLDDALRGRRVASTSLPMPDVTVRTHKLVDVADLDRVLGYKGNYTIFALRRNNYLTLHMMQDYLELGDDVVLRDPDEFAELTVEQLQELAACLHRRDPEVFERHRPAIRRALIEKLSSPRASDLVIVPTTSLYVEALVGTHPLLEDFKLVHRAVDVKKAQAEARHQELENARLADRLYKGNDHDPDVDKHVVVSGGADVTIGTE